MQKDISAVDIEIEDDITSSLNTLLDVRPEGSDNSVNSAANSDRIVWTYNAPVTSSEQHKLCQHTFSNGSSSSHSNSSTSSSPHR